MQAVLAERYAALARARRSLAYPVYALEHGLTSGRISALRAEASRKLQQQGLDEEDWLVWIALATEAGYSYSGDEFWPELAHKTTQWRSNEDRNLLRSWFRRFKNKYGGPIPLGHWADHFSIISWPIANAILPRYLQSHFARYLFDLRFELAHWASAGFEELGHFLQHRYEGDSSRFGEFLQQTDLTARIVLALQNCDQSEATPRIDPQALARIVSDLGERRESREYLGEAQRVIRLNRLRPAGLQAIPDRPTPTPDLSINDKVRPVRLVARAHGARFVLGILFPEVSTVLEKIDVLGTSLSKARMRFHGPNERWVPAEGLLSLSGVDRALRTFPAESDYILEFEGMNSEVSTRLLPLFRLTEPTCWILRLTADGLYREVLGGHIRARGSYLILSRKDFPEAESVPARLLPCKVSLPQLAGYTFEPIDVIPDEVARALRRLNIGVRGGITIEPIGLNPRGSATHRPATWLSTEPVLLRIASDTPIENYHLRLDRGPSRSFTANSGELLLAIDDLEIGQHEIDLLVPQTEGRRQEMQSIKFPVWIAAPQPWPAALALRAGFRLIAAPPNANLEDVLSRKAALQVVGPLQRRVRWSIETYDVAGHLVLACEGDKYSTLVNAPPEAIALVLDRLRECSSDAIDMAHRVDIVASIEELGRQALRFPHTIEPLRWTFDPKNYQVRLIDETSHEVPINVTAYSIATPLRSRTIATSDAIAGITVEAPGTTFLATWKDQASALFASKQAPRLKSLAQLGFEQILTRAEDEVSTLLLLLRSIRLWHSSRPVGHLALVHKARTLDFMQNGVAAIACGATFAEQIKEPGSAALARAELRIGGPSGFGSRIRTIEWSLCAKDVFESFHQLASDFQIEVDNGRCCDAVVVAFEPLEFQLDDANETRIRIEALLANRPLLRGAYLARAAAFLAARSRPHFKAF